LWQRSTSLTIGTREFLGLCHLPAASQIANKLFKHRGFLNIAIVNFIDRQTGVPIIWSDWSNPGQKRLFKGKSGLCESATAIPEYLCGTLASRIESSPDRKAFKTRFQTEATYLTVLRGITNFLEQVGQETGRSRTPMTH
jgi:hypothetical protein